MKLISRKSINTRPAGARPIDIQPVSARSAGIQPVDIQPVSVRPVSRQTGDKEQTAIWPRRWKWIGIFVCVLFLSAGEGSFLQAQAKQEKSEQKEKELKEWIANRQFAVSVDRALPMGGRSIPLTTLYSLELRGDSVRSYLPYFGRAYVAPYGGGNSMDFDAPVTDYDCAYTQKGAAVVRFKAKTNEDNFTFRLQIYPNGSATIQVTPVNRQSITYYGEVVPQKGTVREAGADLKAKTP